MRRRLVGQENAPHLDLQHDVEFLQADGLKVAQSQDARVDDNDIEATKLIHRLGDGVAFRSAVGSAVSALIAKPWFCLHSSIARTVPAALPIRRTDARKVKTDVGAFSRQASGSGGTDATHDPPSTIATLPVQVYDLHSILGSIIDQSSP